MSTGVAMMHMQQKLQQTQCHCSQVSPFNHKFLPFSSTTLPHMSLPAVMEWGYVELIVTLSTSGAMKQECKTTKMKNKRQVTMTKGMTKGYGSASRQWRDEPE